MMAFASLMGPTAMAADFGDFLDLVDIIKGDSDIVDVIKNRDGRHRRRGWLSCNVTKRGWDKHITGHDTCRSCLRKHSKCVETCSREEVTCVVSARSKYGERREVRASARTEWRAQEKAMKKCGRRKLDHCQIEHCEDDSRVVSRSRC